MAQISFFPSKGFKTDKKAEKSLFFLSAFIPQSFLSIFLVEVKISLFGNSPVFDFFWWHSSQQQRQSSAVIVDPSGQPRIATRIKPVTVHYSISGCCHDFSSFITNRTLPGWIFNQCLWRFVCRSLWSHVLLCLDVLCHLFTRSQSLHCNRGASREPMV